MGVVAPVLDRDHRVAHVVGDAVVGEPLAESSAPGVDDAAVGGAYADHLAEIVAADELVIARQLAHRDRNGDPECDQRQQQAVAEHLQAEDGVALDAVQCGAGHLRPD
jgi:hypothetical protein